MVDYTGGLVKTIVRPDGTVLEIFNGILCCPNPNGGAPIVILEAILSDHSGAFHATVLARWSLQYQRKYLKPLRFPLQLNADCGLNLLVALW
jgi:hypothetical protein